MENAAHVEEPLLGASCRHNASAGYGFRSGTVDVCFSKACQQCNACKESTTITHEYVHIRTSSRSEFREVDGVWGPNCNLAHIKVKPVGTLSKEAISGSPVWSHGVDFDELQCSCCIDVA